MTIRHGKAEITDPLEEMLKRTGCIERHYKVQECIAETQDWRKCQNQVQDFKKCMAEYEKKKREGQLTISNTKMVIVVRSDLNMGRGKIASQAAHAAVSLALQSNNSCLASWITTGQAKVILKTDSVDELKELYASAKSSGLNSCAVRDAGRTQVASGALTAVGIGPAAVEQIDKLTKHLKLL